MSSEVGSFQMQGIRESWGACFEHRGVKSIHRGACNVNGGASFIKGGASFVNGGVKYISSGASSVNGGVKYISSGASSVNGGAKNKHRGRVCKFCGASFIAHSSKNTVQKPKNRSSGNENANWN
ncbi:MAG: hypothetical protein JZU53_09830 [Paludibacter sp.]|nr:hypothetical protein [Paludibacter sp.]